MKKWLSAIFFAMLLMLAACGQANKENAQEQLPTEQGTTGQAEETSEVTFPLTITDASGKEVTLEKAPERIVSLIPSITETLFAIDAGDKIIGRTDYCNYPEEALEIQSVGGLQFDVETILSLEPDLVLSHASSAHSSEGGLKQIEEAGIPVVVVIDAKQIEDVYKAIEMIATVTDAKEKGEEVIAGMKEGFANISEKAKKIADTDRLNVWVEVSPAPELYTPGTGTFLHELLEMIHANNVAKDVEGWVAFTEEEAVALQPDVIVTTYGYYVEDPVAEVKKRTAWQDVPAVKNDRVYDVHSDAVTRSGPRLVKGVEELASFIYPEVFN